MNVKVTGAVFCLLLLVAVSLSSEHDDTLIDLEGERVVRSPLEEIPMMQVCDVIEDSVTSQTDENDDTGILVTTAPRVIYTDLDGFLNVIHKSFVECVQIAETTFVDTLRAEGGLCQDEEEEIRGEITTRDKARALWNTLHRLPPRFFQEKCMPFLKQWYPHVLNGADFVWEANSDLASRCLRHVIIKRMTLRRFADVFPPVGACTHDEYTQLTGRKGKWPQAFKLLKKHSGNERLRQAVLCELKGIAVRPSHCFVKLFRNGFPCTCHCSPVRVCPQQTLVRNPCLNDVSPTSTESSGSAGDERMESSDSEYSGHSSSFDMDQGRQPDTATTFRSRQEKVAFKVMLNKVNGALIDASLVEPIFRKMESLKEDARSLTQKAPDEEAWALEDSSHLVSLRDEVARELKKLKTLYGKVKRAMHAGCEWKTTHFDDASLNVKLRARQHLLERKARQAERFYRRSVNMVKCVPLSIQPRNHT